MVPSRLESDIQTALVELKGAVPVRTQHEWSGVVPFKFVLTRSSRRALPATAAEWSVVNRLFDALHSWEEEEKVTLIECIEDDTQSSVVSSILCTRRPFCNLAESTVNSNVARAVFATILPYDDVRCVRTFAGWFATFWNQATSSHTMTVDTFMPCGMPMLECDILVPCVRTDAQLDAKLFLFQIRSVLESSVLTLAACLMPCLNCPIPTLEYDVFLERVRESCVRIASLQGVAEDDVNAFVLACVCAAVDGDSFSSLIESCKHTLAFEPPQGAASFAWVAACACLRDVHSEDAAADLAHGVLTYLTTMSTTNALERLVALVLSTRTRAGFDMVMSTDDTTRAACANASCLDILSQSPSGLLGIDDYDSAVQLIALVISSACERGCDAALTSVRRFVAIDDALGIAGTIFEPMIEIANVQLERALQTRRGAIGFLGPSDSMESHARRARGLRRKTVLAIREACRCRVDAHTPPPVLLAWLSAKRSIGDAHAPNAAVVFARRFSSSVAVDDYKACFDFEDELRIALQARTKGFDGVQGSISRANLTFPHLDMKTTQILSKRPHAALCSRVRLCVNAHACVSVACV